MKYMFTAEWCGHCKSMKSVVEKIPDVQIIDVEENPELAEKYQVMSLPSYVIDNGDVQFKTGLFPEEIIREFYK